MPTSNPFFKTQQQGQSYTIDRSGAVDPYMLHEASISMRELLDPTRIIFALTLALFLLPVLVLKKRVVTPLDRSETWIVVFSLILIANVLAQSWRVAFGLRVAVDAFIIPFVAYAVVRRLVTTEERFRQLVRILGYIGCYLIAIAMVERLTHQGLNYRLHGPFQSNQIFQVVLAVAFFAAWSERSQVTGLFALKQDVRCGIRQFVLIFTLPIIFLTWSRGNMAGFLSGACVYLLLGRRLINPRRKFGAIGWVLMLISTVAIAAAALEIPDALTDRLANTSTVESRFVTWTRLLQEGITAPVFGIGLNNLRNVLNQDWRFLSTVHNCYLALFIELGAIGLTSYVIVVVSIIQTGLRLARTHVVDTTARWRGIAVVAVIVAQQVPSLFANNLYLTEFGHVLVFTFVGGVVGRYGQYRFSANPFAVLKTTNSYRRHLTGSESLAEVRPLQIGSRD